MGLFSNVVGDGPAKRPTDDVLLLLSMMLMIEADDVVDASEQATFTAFSQTLPEFRDVEDAAWDRMVEEARRLRRSYRGREIEAVKELEAIESVAIRRKTFVLAVDLALASGDIDAREEQLLVAMQRTLAIDDGVAENVVEVLGFKYAR